MTHLTRQEQQFLRHFIDSNAMTMAEIVKEVAEEAEVQASDLLAPTRGKKRVSQARMFCMWKIRTTGATLEEIGAFFGRDHTTVSHAIKTVEALQ